MRSGRYGLLAHIMKDFSIGRFSRLCRNDLFAMAVIHNSVTRCKSGELFVAAV